MRLERLKVKGFRCVKDCGIDFPNGLPLVLIGENATGKSTIIDAAAMVCAVASGEIDRAILDRGGWGTVARGGIGGEVEFVARFATDLHDIGAVGCPVEYTIRLGHKRGAPAVIDEEIKTYALANDHDPILILKGGVSRWLRDARTGATEAVPMPCSGDPLRVRPVLADVADGTMFPTAFRVREALSSIAVHRAFAFGIHTERVNHAERIERSAIDLIVSLHALSKDDRIWRAFTADLRAVFPWCASMEFQTGIDCDAIELRWFDSRSGSSLGLDDMSEGMRVYLALLAALHDPSPHALMAFDEPVSGLHPHTIRRLVKTIESRSEQNPVIVATHADRFLDYLEYPAESIRIIRISEHDGVVVEKIDSDLMASWLRDYSLSDLRSKEILEAP